MRVIRREFFNIKRPDLFKIVPLGDVHIGAAACDEELFRQVVKGIAKDPDAYWIGMGDMCDWINVQDRRSDLGVLAEWISVADLVDLGSVQKERFCEIVSPIAHKCLALVEGNHEISLRKHTERDVYREIVAQVKGDSGLSSGIQLAIGVYGWLQLCFYRSKRREHSHIVNINLHHGFTGGKLAGGKALNMQRWLWTHNADICFWGHSHNVGIQPEAVEEIDDAGNVRVMNRRGAFAGTFLRTVNDDGPSTYSEEKGYFPLPYGGVMAELRPGAAKRKGMIRMVYEG